jgi:hypothetical protein
VNWAPEVVSRIEELGGYLALEIDGSIRYRVPKGNPEAQALLETIKTQKQNLVSYLRARPVLPPGVRLVSWNLKEPPVAIETCAVVTDPALFVRATVEQLGVALAHPGRWVGWSVPQLIDRLAQVGVVVMLEKKLRGCEEANKC